MFEKGWCQWASDQMEDHGAASAGNVTKLRSQPSCIRVSSVVPPMGGAGEGTIGSAITSGFVTGNKQSGNRIIRRLGADDSMQLLLIILRCLLRLVPSGVKTVRRGGTSLRPREASFFPNADLGHPGSPFVGWLNICPVSGAFWNSLDCYAYLPVAGCRDGVGGRVPVPVTSRPRHSALGRRKPVATRRF